MTIQAASNLSVGNFGSYSVRFSGLATAAGASSQPTQTATLRLLNSSIQSSLGSSSLSVSRSGSTSTSITTSASNFSGNVALSLTGLPFGVSYTMSPATLPGDGDSSLNIKAGPNAKPGTYTVLVRTAAGGASVLSALELVIS